MNNLNTRTAEAKIQVRIGDTDSEWCDSLDFDPINIPVEDSDPKDGIPLVTDAFDATVIGLLDAMIAADTLPMNDPQSRVPFDYNIVWSGSGRSVKAVCPVCDDVFILSEGCLPDTDLPDLDAVSCGCDPADSGMGD